MWRWGRPQKAGRVGTCRTQFSPSTMWIVGLEPRASPLLAEPSGCPQTRGIHKRKEGEGWDQKRNRIHTKVKLLSIRISSDNVRKINVSVITDTK